MTVRPTLNNSSVYCSFVTEICQAFATQTISINQMCISDSGSRLDNPLNRITYKSTIKVHWPSNALQRHSSTRLGLVACGITP